MPKTKQLTVILQNRPGELAKVANALGSANINILAFLATPSRIEECVQLVVDDVDKAKEALEAKGFSYAQQEMLCVEIPNRAGALGNLAGKVAAKNINILSAYATTATGSTKASVVLGVSNLDAAARLR